MLQPYENENLIFIDTEYSSLDPETGVLLSIGVVKLSGEEFYLELEHTADVSDWVQEHIIPMLTQEKVSAEEAAKQIRDFIGDSLPFAVAFVDNYDVILLTKLLGAGELPFRWATIDFASILFAIGVNPVKFLPGEKGAASFYRKLGIKYGKYRKHHALDDAKLLRDVWLKITEQTADSDQPK